MIGIRWPWSQTITWLRRGMKHCVRTREWRLNMSPREHQKLVHLSNVNPPTVRSGYRCQHSTLLFFSLVRKPLALEGQLMGFTAC